MKEAPPAFNSAKFSVFPWFVFKLKVKVSSSVRVGLANKCVEENLKIGF
jgi:hypothetical protein